jgi:uncharacterized protein YjbJ (UPF0337 family)
MSNPMGGYQSPSSTTAAKDEAANVGQTAKEATGQVATTATEQAKNVADETKRQAKGLIDQAGSQVTEQAGAQKDKASAGLRSLADELRSMAEGNGARGGMTGDLARQAADKAHAFAGWLDERDPGSLLEEIRQLARRKPGTFLIGAALAGVAAGRLTRGVVAANSSSTPSGDSVLPAGSSMPTATPIGDQASTAVYSSTPGSDDSFTAASAPGMSSPATAPLVVEPERTPARQGATGAGLGREEEQR